MHQTSNVTLGEHGAACWDESFPEARATLPCDAAQCPDVFINVNYVNASTKGQTQRLGYIRLKMQECYGFNHAQQWNTLERDPLYTVVRTHGMRFWMETPAPGDAFLKFTNLNGHLR